LTAVTVTLPQRPKVPGKNRDRRTHSATVKTGEE